MLRDYHDELENQLTLLDDDFRVDQMQLYAEHAPTPAPTVATDAKINAADDQVTDLCKDARRAQFAADSLSLARDTAQLGMLYNEVSKSEAAERTEKVLHLKNQNAIGASIVADFMTGNLAIHSGPVKDQLNLLERVGLMKRISQE